MKEPVLFLWLEGATFHWVIVGYNNEYLTRISCKFNVKDISMSNKNELHDKRSTKNSEASFT